MRTPLNSAVLNSGNEKHEQFGLWRFCRSLSLSAIAFTHLRVVGSRKPHLCWNLTNARVRLTVAEKVASGQPPFPAASQHRCASRFIATNAVAKSTFPEHTPASARSVRRVEMFSRYQFKIFNLDALYRKLRVQIPRTAVPLILPQEAPILRREVVALGGGPSCSASARSPLFRSARGVVRVASLVKRDREG